MRRLCDDLATMCICNFECWLGFSNSTNTLTASVVGGDVKNNLQPGSCTIKESVAGGELYSLTS